MKNVIIFLILLLAAGMLGCGRQPQTRHIVILTDVSGSIERQALDQAFKAIDNLVSHLNRGDRIAIIPILSDAQAEASGRIIQFEVPKERRAYDADVQDFRHRLTASLAEMQASALAYPGANTDILGTIVLAEEEFQAVPSHSTKILLILSDLVQEDAEVNFRNDQRLTSATRAKEFATKIVKQTNTNLQGVLVYLGLLRSTAYGKMNGSRKSAIQQFWTQYLWLSGAQPKFVIDGVGLLNNLLSAS